MKNSFKKVIIASISLLIVILSLVFCILDASKELNIWTHPALNFLFSLLFGFGLLSTVYGFTNKSTMYILIGTLLLTPTIFYVVVQYIDWWIALLCSFSYAVCVIIISSSVYGNKTNFADNNSPDYKNYLEREKEQPKEEEKEVELPKIKSFK